MTQLHRGMGGTAPEPTLRRHPHQAERRLVEDIAFRVLAADAEQDAARMIRQETEHTHQ